MEAPLLPAEEPEALYWKDWLRESDNYLKDRLGEQGCELLARYTGWTGWVAWLQPGAVEESDREEARNKKITHFYSAGPVAQEIWHATPVEWIFAAIFPFFVAWLSVCPSDQQPFAHYPFWALAAFIPVVFWAMYCEVNALRWVLPTLAAYCAPFKFFGPRSFNSWLLLMFMLSLASHGDLVTNGLFLAKVLATVGCSGARTQVIVKVWKVTIQEASCVSWIPGFNNLGTLFLMVWGLMFIQLIVCVLYALPCERGVSYEAKSMPKGYQTPWAKVFGTYLPETDERAAGKFLWHADVIQWLATVNRMVSITDRNMQWSLERAKEELAIAEQMTDEKMQTKQYKRGLDIVSAEYIRITVRIALVSLVEKALMLEAQVTIFAISRFLLPRGLMFRFDGQMLFSLALSFLVFLKAVGDAISQLQSVIDFKRDVPRVDNIEVKRAKHKMFITTLFFCSILFLLVVCLLHSAMKLLMAFQCHDSMWNLHNPFKPKPGVNTWGCVDLSEIEKVLYHPNATVAPVR